MKIEAPCPYQLCAVTAESPPTPSRRPGCGRKRSTTHAKSVAPHHRNPALRSAGFRWWGATLLACVVDLFLPQPGRLLGVGGLSAVTAQSWYGQGASIFTPPLIAYFAIGTLVHGVALSALARRWGFEAAAAAAGLSLATVNVYDVFVSSGDAGEFSFIYRYFFLRISHL